MTTLESPASFALGRRRHPQSAGRSGAACGGLWNCALVGPLLVELPDTVVVLRPGQRGMFDEFGRILIDL